MMYRKIVILTGAGISAESGLNTFRDQDGLWEKHKIEDVATPEGYAKDKTLVENFYNARWQQLKDANVKPNAAHLALAKLEREFNGDCLLVTQNIDDLHERAGSTHLLHMHGELNKGRCPMTDQTFILSEPFGENNLCTCCISGERLRPHVVWFGEMPIGLERIYDALESCDLFIAIGTSGTVYPAAGFVETANHFGAHSIEINPASPSPYTQFKDYIQAKAGDAVPRLVEQILSGREINI